MKDIAPHIFRQRLLIEGFYSGEVTRDSLAAYLLGITAHLGLRSYGEPVIFSPATGMGRGDNAGFDAFLPLIDSGIASYVWSSQRFVSVLLYSCKSFDEDAAIAYTRASFAIPGEIASKSI